MKQLISLLISLIFLKVSSAQDTQRYLNSSDESHFCGPIQIDDLKKDTIFKKWYNQNYSDYKVVSKERGWVKKLGNVDVDVYLGTWCGDSKKWVPKFVKLWDELGLKRSQLKFTALYDFIEGKYKQGPNGEDKGKDIHRVPTFIFKRNGKEIARIVEFPNNDLETDLAQIAVGFPSFPNYRGASRMIDLLKMNSSERIKNNREYLNEVYQLVSESSELNTLGYVYLESGRIDQALTVFYFNTLFFTETPNVYDSYAEALAISGQKEEAIKNYEKVLQLDQENKHAIEQIKKLKE